MATASVAPTLSSSCGRWVAQAVPMNMLTAKNRLSSATSARCGVAAAGCTGGGAAAVADGVGADAVGEATRGSSAFSGSPTSRCSAAQPRQAPRQPCWPSIQALSGQPTVLAKPAISVMPVIGLRAAWPYSRTSVAKAASYRPAPIASPITAQAANRPQGPWASASSTRPSAKMPLQPSSTGRPPTRSMARPAAGPTAAETTSASEKARYTIGGGSPRSVAIGWASTAGR